MQSSNSVFSTQVKAFVDSYNSNSPKERETKANQIKTLVGDFVTKRSHKALKEVASFVGSLDSNPDIKMKPEAKLVILKKIEEALHVEGSTLPSPKDTIERKSSMPSPLEVSATRIKLVINKIIETNKTETEKAISSSKKLSESQKAIKGREVEKSYKKEVAGDVKTIKDRLGFLQSASDTDRKREVEGYLRTQASRKRDKNVQALLLTAPKEKREEYAKALDEFDEVVFKAVDKDLDKLFIPKKWRKAGDAPYDIPKDMSLDTLQALLYVKNAYDRVLELRQKEFEGKRDFGKDDFILKANNFYKVFYDNLTDLKKIKGQENAGGNIRAMETAIAKAALIAAKVPKGIIDEFDNAALRYLEEGNPSATNNYKTEVFDNFGIARLPEPKSYPQFIQDHIRIAKYESPSGIIQEDQ